MSESYEYIDNNKRLRYTNSEYPGVVSEVYVFEDETINNDKANKLQARAAFENYITNLQITKPLENITDKVWMNGSLARTDYSITSTEGQRIKGILDTNFPGTNYARDNRNLVSEFTPNREPYENNSVSWYDMQAIPDSLKTQYSVNYNEYTDWYGMKFDLTTNKILLKVVIELDDPVAQELIEKARPNFPTQEREVWNKTLQVNYIALIHEPDGTVTNQVDFFLNCSDVRIKEFCDANSLTFPYDYSDKSLRDRVWTWGIVFNRTTGAPIHVKAYERV